MFSAPGEFLLTGCAPAHWGTPQLHTFPEWPPPTTEEDAQEEQPVLPKEEEEEEEEEEAKIEDSAVTKTSCKTVHYVWFIF